MAYGKSGHRCHHLLHAYGLGLGRAMMVAKLFLPCRCGCCRIHQSLMLWASWPAFRESIIGSGRWAGAESEVAMTGSGLTTYVPPTPGTRFGGRGG